MYISLELPNSISEALRKKEENRRDFPDAIKCKACENWKQMVSLIIKKTAVWAKPFTRFGICIKKNDSVKLNNIHLPSLLRAFCVSVRDSMESWSLSLSEDWKRRPVAHAELFFFLDGCTKGTCCRRGRYLKQ